MLLAPWKRHRSQRQPIPEPAPWRWCTLRTHLFSSLLCSSLVSGSLAASTPTWNKHTFTQHRTKSSFRTESCSSSWKKTHGYYFNSSNNEAMWEKGGSCQVMCNVDASVTSRECLSGHTVVHGNSLCSWGSVPPTAPKNERAGNEC